VDQQEKEVNEIDQPLSEDSDLRMQGLKILAAIIARRHSRPPKDSASITNDTGHDSDAIDGSNDL